MKFTDTIASVLLDLLRGVAAVIVLIEHWRNLLFVPYPLLAQKTAIWKVFYSLTGGGRQSVMIFFVLSGYLVAGSVMRAKKAGRWSWADYMEHRLARLWTVLLIALPFVAICDVIGLHVPRARPLYFGVHSANMLQDAGLHLGPLSFLENVFFLQGIHGPMYGSDGALWSLSYEFWYYVLFPLLLFAVFGAGLWRSRALQGVLALAIAAFVGWDILLLFPVWLMGAGLNYVPAPKSRPRLVAGLLPLYVLMIFARNIMNATLQSYLLGLQPLGSCG